MLMTNHGDSIGSSPLARGTPAPVSVKVVRQRFIPAGAGNTGEIQNSTWSHAVHPRWRGEHRAPMVRVVKNNGSSPLARGTLPRAGRLLSFWRFIPAGAGNTMCRCSSMSGMPVHPRWRGEHCSTLAIIIDRRGSSPLARGTLRAEADRVRHHRFIPAGAGNTALAPLPSRSKPVHPRWRGEHDCPPYARRRSRGSSPLARGTPIGPSPYFSESRFIPAGAGNTGQDQAGKMGPSVHPRWRGEHPVVLADEGVGRGSSPLARGTRGQQVLDFLDRRFIPAGAGNTSPQHKTVRRQSVHPRWRGEHVRIGTDSDGYAGSSPLARGTR